MERDQKIPYNNWAWKFSHSHFWGQAVLQCILIHDFFWVFALKLWTLSSEKCSNPQTQNFACNSKGSVDPLGSLSKVLLPWGAGNAAGLRGQNEVRKPIQLRGAWGKNMLKAKKSGSGGCSPLPFVYRWLWMDKQSWIWQGHPHAGH